MIKSGTRPNRIDHRDYDFVKSHRKHLLRKFGSTTPTFPTEYLCDYLGNTRNQNINDTTFTPQVTAEPEGCTNFAQAGLANDIEQGATIFRPDTLEALSHANADGGTDVRTSLNLASNEPLNWFAQFFNVIAHAPLDYFDTFRLAIFSGAPEKRSISWGTPWFPSWEAACQGTNIVYNADGTYTTSAGDNVKKFLMPVPTAVELAAIAANPGVFPWHNHKLDGWAPNNGSPVLRDESWQGTDAGVNGYIGFDRATVNTVMQIPGTVAFTATRTGIDNPKTIDVSVIQYIVSFIRNLMPFSYGKSYAK